MRRGGSSRTGGGWLARLPSLGSGSGRHCRSVHMIAQTERRFSTALASESLDRSSTEVHWC